MRILHFNLDGVGAPYSGGQARREFEVNQRLATRHDITVVTAGHRSLRDETINGVRYIRMLPLPQPLNFISYFAEIVPRGLWSTADLIVEDFAVPFTASLLARLTPKPIVGVASYLFAKDLAAKYHLPFDWCERFALARYPNIIALTPWQRGILTKLAPRARIAVIPNGADPRASAFPWSGAGGYIAFLGRVDIAQKGLDLLLDAVAATPQLPPLKIAGGGPGQVALNEEIRKRGLTGRVQYLGLIAGDAKHRFLADAALGVFPSRHENLPLVLLDALNIGVPIVAFDIPALRAVLEGAAELVPPFESAELGRRMLAVASDPFRARAIGAALHARAERYDYDEITREQESFYLSAVATHAQRVS